MEELDNNVHQEVLPEEAKLLEPAKQEEGQAQVETEPHEEEEEEEASAKRDSELEQAENDEERERIRERRREERKNKQKRQRERIVSQENEIRMLRDALGNLTTEVASIRTSTFQQAMGTVDMEIRNAAIMADRWTHAEAAAIQKSDGIAATQARAQADAARQRVRELQWVKQNAAAQATQQQTQPSAIDPVIQNKAGAFVSRHSWYRGPQSTDEDSAILTAIDRVLAAEGWDQRSDAYYEELEARAAKRLPHRFGNETAASDNKRPRQPVAGSTTGTGTQASSAGQKGGYRLSEDRVRAMKEAGIWDDPKRRDAAIKRYREYDAQHQR